MAIEFETQLSKLETAIGEKALPNSARWTGPWRPLGRHAGSAISLIVGPWAEGIGNINEAMSRLFRDSLTEGMYTNLRGYRSVVRDVTNSIQDMIDKFREWQKVQRRRPGRRN